MLQHDVQRLPGGPIVAAGDEHARHTHGHGQRRLPGCLIGAGQPLGQQRVGLPELASAELDQQIPRLPADDAPVHSGAGSAPRAGSAIAARKTQGIQAD
jgi:hypothetical protein